MSTRSRLAFAKRIVGHAHQRGLAVAQKNTPEFGSRGRRIAQFDFAIAEECQRYSECNRFTNVYGNHVVEVEYTDYPRAVFERACELRGANLSVLLRDRNVTARHSGEYRYEAC
jgi:hypothetical protein